MEEKTQRSRRSLRERNRKILLWGVAPVCVLGMLALRLAFQAYRIPSSSMYPALASYDHVFVSRFAYGVFTKVLPARGDVVVFDFPEAPDGAHQSFVKRVVGLPGDSLSVEAGHPIINGWRVPSCFVARVKARLEPTPMDLDLFVEFLDDASYLVAIMPESFTGPQGPYQVAEGEAFVLGDNRDNSSDSRVWRDGKGAGVARDKITGRLSIFWSPLSRLGRSVHGAPRLPELEPSPEKALAACLAKRPPRERTKPPPAKPAR